MSKLEKELRDKIKHYENSHEWDGDFNDEIYGEFVDILKRIYLDLFNKPYIPVRDFKRKCGYCCRPLEINIKYPIFVEKYTKRLDGGNRYMCNSCYKNNVERYEAK